MDKLNYLTLSQPNIAYHVSVLSQLLSTQQMSHWIAVIQNAVIQILWYLKRPLAENSCNQIVIINV